MKTTAIGIVVFLSFFLDLAQSWLRVGSNWQVLNCKRWLIPFSIRLKATRLMNLQIGSIPTLLVPVLWFRRVLLVIPRGRPAGNS